MQHPLLQRHVGIMKNLGRDGMSTDESDHEELGTNVVARTRATRFYVLAPAWRRAEVGEFLDAIDTVSFVMRRSSGKKSGSFLRTRIHSNSRPRYSKRKAFIPGLPLNTYRPSWIDGRTDLDLVVCPTPAPYDFSHDPRLLESVARYRI